VASTEDKKERGRDKGGEGGTREGQGRTREAREGEGGVKRLVPIFGVVNFQLLSRVKEERQPGARGTRDKGGTREGQGRDKGGIREKQADKGG
jgi:hypothetical protein